MTQISNVAKNIAGHGLVWLLKFTCCDSCPNPNCVRKERSIGVVEEVSKTEGSWIDILMFHCVPSPNCSSQYPKSISKDAFRPYLQWLQQHWVGQFEIRVPAQFWVLIKFPSTQTFKPNFPSMLTNTTGGLLTPPPLKKYALFFLKRVFQKSSPHSLGLNIFFWLPPRNPRCFMTWLVGKTLWVVWLGSTKSECDDRPFPFQPRAVVRTGDGRIY